MNRKWQNILLVLLPVLIVGFIIYNAGVMSRIYILENGLNQDSKVCKVRILPDRYDLSLKSGESCILNLAILNQGNFILPASGSNPVHLSYHVLDKKKKILEYENERFALPNDLRPDTETKINIELLLKMEPGDYILEFDMVEEGVCWFGDKGSPTTLVKLHIKD